MNVILKHRYFSLTELLVVVTLLSILVSLLSPSLRKIIGTSERDACRNNLHQIMLGETFYIEDHHGYLQPIPYTGSKQWKDYLTPYFSVQEILPSNPRAVFHCPSVTMVTGSNQWMNVGSYIGNVDLHLKASYQLSNLSQWMFAIDGGRHNGNQAMRRSQYWNGAKMVDSNYLATSYLNFRHIDDSMNISFLDTHLETFSILDYESNEWFGAMLNPTK